MLVRQTRPLRMRQNYAIFWLAMPQSLETHVLAAASDSNRKICASCEWFTQPKRIKTRMVNWNRDEQIGIMWHVLYASDLRLVGCAVAICCPGSNGYRTMTKKSYKNKSRKFNWATIVDCQLKLQRWIFFCRDTRSNVTASSSNDANSVELEKQIEVQNHEYFKVYDYIKEHVSEEDRFAILNCNKQTVPAADDQVNQWAYRIEVNRS